MVYLLCNAQDFPYSLYDFDDQYNQYAGHHIAELNNELYVMGLAMDTSITVEGYQPERNLHLTVFDLDGKLLRSAFWNNLAYPDETMFTIALGFQFNQDKVIIPYGTSRGWDSVVSVDQAMDEEFRVIAFDDEQGDPETRRFVTSMIWPEDELKVLQVNDDRVSFFISSLDLDASQDFIHNEIILEPVYNYLPRKLFSKDSDKMVVAGVYSNQVAPSRDEHQFGSFLTTLDTDLNLLKHELIGTEYSGSSLSAQYHLDAEGNLLLSIGKVDMERYREVGDFRYYTVIMKYDIESSEILWETPLDSMVFRRVRSTLSDMVDSHQRDGYIVVGRGAETFTGGTTALLYAKISNSGEMIWKKEIFDPFPPSSLIIYSVVATSDGHYMLSGIRSDVAEGDGYDTRGQLILMKFDEDGNVIDLRTDTEEVEQVPFSIIPNPAQDKVIIATGMDGEKHIHLTDMTGQSIAVVLCDTQDCSVDISGLVTGTYVILAADRQGNLLGKEQLVIQR